MEELFCLSMSRGRSTRLRRLDGRAFCSVSDDDDALDDALDKGGERWSPACRTETTGYVGDGADIVQLRTA